MLHRIIVKYTPLVTDRDTFAEEVLGIFKPLETMDGIRRVGIVKGLPLAENRWDLMIEIEMEKSALPAYNESAPHKKWKTEYACFVEKKAIFDCEQ